MGLHIFRSGYNRLQTKRCVCVWGGGYLKPYESSPMFSNMRGWTGGRPLPSRPLSPSFLLEVARAKFSYFPSFPYFYIFSPSSYSRPLFSLPLPPPPSYPVRPIKYHVEDERCKMAGGDCRCFALHSREG